MTGDLIYILQFLHFVKQFINNSQYYLNYVRISYLNKLRSSYLWLVKCEYVLPLFCEKLWMLYIYFIEP